MKPVLNSFIPLIFDGCLLLQAQPQKEAHEAAKAKKEIFVGVSSAIKNRAAFAEMVHAQIKTMSFLAYVIKSGLPAIKEFAPILPGVSVRLLKDCPPEAAVGRKELLVAVRHILGTEFRVHFAGQIDLLLDDRVLLGTGITSREMHQPLAISMLADLIHHSRAELSAMQLSRIVHVHSRVLHDPTLAPAIQTMCAKLLLNLVEAIITNDPTGANRLLRQILDAFIEKMANLPRFKEDWEINRKRRESLSKSPHANSSAVPGTGPVDAVDVVSIERSQPIYAGHMLYDHRESDVLKDVLFLLRNLFTGFKTLLALLKRRGAPEPDADTFGALFRGGLECWSMIDFRDPNQEKEMMDLFIPTFYDLSPQTFHELFTTHLPFLYEKLLSNNSLMGVPQNLLSMNSTSRRFVGIVLRFLADRLEDLGNADRKNATITLRLFKLAFMAVTIYPEENESMLQPHLGYLIMHSMKLAAKASEPSNFFLLLRALFRSIGGGKFELLYKDVLPLLPVMLEQLHTLMDAAEPPQRETFVDLCLTVPVRLSALLPYLGYLMKPLVLALRSSGDLLSQGLRTLELCIDNLTQEFLDPIMAPYQADIMNALWAHLQPLPHPHAHSHTTMRILGKMGGRNRRVLQQPPAITWRPYKEVGSFAVHFVEYTGANINGHSSTSAHVSSTLPASTHSSPTQSMSLKPILDLACANVRRGDSYYRRHSWELLKHAAAFYADGTMTYGQQQKQVMFEKVVHGIFEATRVEEIVDEARQYAIELSDHVFYLETKRFASEPNQRELPAAGLSPLANAYFGGIVESLSSITNEPADLNAYTALILELLSATMSSCQIVDSSGEEASKSPSTLWLFMIKRFSSKLCGLCYDKLWTRKTGGWTILNSIVREAGLPVTWLRDNQLEIVRALIFMLKDMPTDPPRNAEQVGETLLYVLRTANLSNKESRGEELGQGESKGFLSDDEKTQLERHRENQQALLIGALVGELASSNSIVRSVTCDAFRLLAELRGQGVTELLTPVKERLLGPIFGKPLRALPFGMQIGHIDAITFCLNLNPPLPAFNEELFRVLTEACALADADDAALVGRTSHYKNTIAVTNLRVVAIRLLASAMDRPEFQGPKHQEQRLRIISMYFKSLYSRSNEVVRVAFDSLKDTLKDSHKLPKDVLRSGLSPILQTLADSSKLTVVGLDGLARLLRLLTTYFKVEIGGKLLSHMQAISQTSILERASAGDLESPRYADAHHLLHSKMPRDSDVVETLCAIVRVFPLLPAAAVQFMEQLVSTIVHIESTLRRCGATPFTEPLATYLDKYPAKACEFFQSKSEDPRYGRCFRLCIGIAGASALRQELSDRRDSMIISVLMHPNSSSQTICSTLNLIKTLTALDERWLVNYEDVFAAVKALWRSTASKQRRRDETSSGPHSEIVLILDVMRLYLVKRNDIGAYFDLLDAFTHLSSIDLTSLLRFCYRRVAIDGSIAFKREVISRWIETFESTDLGQDYKCQVLRVLVNPILFATQRPRGADTNPGCPLRTAKASAAVEKAAPSPGAVVVAGSPQDVEMIDTAKEPVATASEKSQATREDEGQVTPLFDSQLFASVLNRVWKPFQIKTGLQLCSDDAHRVELLHMSTMTLEHCFSLLTSQGGPRRETIKFGWAHISSEDVTVKNAAYIFVARFLEYCESPMKIIGQVYTGMLRIEKTEGRGLLRRALDILVPALPTRVPVPTDGGPPFWVRWTKSLLATESHTSPVLINIMQLLVRHGDQFYAYRDSFVPQMASSLARFGGGQSLEHKILAIDVVDLIVDWEKKRNAALAEPEMQSSEAKIKLIKGDEEAASRKRRPDESGDGGKGEEKSGTTTSDGDTSRKRTRLDDAGNASSISSSSDNSHALSGPRSDVANASDHLYSVPKNVRETLVNFLLRAICFSTEAMTRGAVGRAFLTYREIASLGFWSICDIKLNIFQRPLMAADTGDAEPFSNAFNIVCNSLQALRVICKDKSDAWFVAHAPQLCKLLEKSVRMKQPIIIELTRSIMERVFEAVPDIQPEDKDAEGEEDDDDDAAAAASVAAAAGGKLPDAKLAINMPAPETKSTHHDPDEVPGIVRTFGDAAINEGFTEWRNPYASFVILGAWGKSKPERIDAYLHPLIKALSRFTKEHLAQQQSVKPYSVDAQIKLLLMALDLTKTRISHLGEQRRWWLSAAVQLGEKSTSIEVCRFLLNTLSKWVLEGKEQFPTVKEKAGLLVKMISYENRDHDDLLKEYLELIYNIYTSPHLARTELTVKLEPAFLLGCRHRDPKIREKFIDVFDRTLIRTLPGRMQYLLGQQSWEHLAEHFWITQMLDLFLGSLDEDMPFVPALLGTSSRLSSFASAAKGFTTGTFVKSLRRLIYISRQGAHDIFVEFFRAAWAALARKHQIDLTRSLIGILTREYHLRQVTRRPNIVQALLNAAQACRPQPELPPHVVKYLGKTFKVWHTSVDILQSLLNTLPREDDSIREATQDAQAEMFAELAEDDAFYGLWRRRCVYAESNAAIAFEQSGLWAKAQIAYESAQMKARTGVLTFTEAEYSLWEDHWVICAQKLQQWEILTDLAKLEGNNDLLLECAWRLSDWVQEKDYLEQALDSLYVVPTPRRRVFAAFMALLKHQDRTTTSTSSSGSGSEFGSICDEAIQLSLRKWHSLPSTVTQAHVPLLQIFQQFVELQEASTIFLSLAQTNATNIDQRSADLKTLMQTWRERLPNLCDDINAWSDLVAWRQHVFSAVNKAYLPLVPHLQSGQGSSTNSYAYRGYHETAWIINRFAHVARKHRLNDVCISSLTKIYTLPNIEIQEAFLKLREQAKCHYKNSNELAQGLEVINNTNLMFFAAPQKAEFFTLKGMFMEKLGLSEDANHAFATAIQMDLSLGKAWIEWGRYNERMLRDQPMNAFFAASAMSCYLQAASLYKNSKVRKVLIRVLWLLSAENSQMAAIQAFESFRGEHPTWYWVTFIPQLLSALGHREVVVAKRILISIAKSYPQALYLHVRTTKEEYALLRRNFALHRAHQARKQITQAHAQKQAQAQVQAQAQSSPQLQSQSQLPQAAATAPKAKDLVDTAGKEQKEESKIASQDRDTQMADAETSLHAQQDQFRQPHLAATDADKTATAEPAAKSDIATASRDSDALPGDASAQLVTDSKNLQSTSIVVPPVPETRSSPSKDAALAPGASSPTSASSGQVSQQAPANGATPQTSSFNVLSSEGQAQSARQQQQQQAQTAVPQPWDHVDGVLNVLKTAFPLLALTMENMAEQIVQRFKASPEEDLHRLMNALLSEAMQQYISRATVSSDDGSLPAPTRQNLLRFSENLHRSPLRSSFEEDFIKSEISLRECVQRLQQWRDRYETAIDRRPTRYPLEHCSHYLVEFQHLKFDEVEVPGQYLGHEDNNSDFTKISRFSNTFEVTRSSGSCTRRLSMLSNKGITHSFAVQLNTPRHCRREERTMQLLRCLNGILERRIETRKRGLNFRLPTAIPLATHARLVESDASFVSLHEIYEEHCREMGMSKDDPIMLWVEKMKSTWDPTKGMVELANLRMDLLDEISTKMVPETVLSSFMTRSMTSPEDLWLMRKQFTLQTAATMFITYVFFISARTPGRIHISRSSGSVVMSDLLPSFNPQMPQYKSPDATPFRLSPNMQHFIGPIGVEGILTSSLMAIGRCLSEPNGKFEDVLGIFVKDDLPRDAPLQLVMRTVSEVAKRAKLLSGHHQNRGSGTATPVNSSGSSATDNSSTLVVQVILDLINSATSPGKLAMQDASWHPWL